MRLGLLCAVLSAPILPGCALTWTDSENRINRLGLLWIEESAPDETRITAVTTLGLDLQAGPSCYGLQVGWREQILATYSGPDRVWRAHFNTADPFDACLRQVPAQAEPDGYCPAPATSLTPPPPPAKP